MTNLLSHFGVFLRNQKILSSLNQLKTKTSNKFQKPINKSNNAIRFENYITLIVFNI